MKAKHLEISTASDLRKVFPPSKERASATRRFLCGSLALGLFLATMGEARSAYIYWSDFNGGDIRRANLDGTGQKILFTGLSNPLGPALDLAGGKMYWGNAGSNLRRANLDGTGQQILYSGSVGAPSLNLASSQMYWNESNGRICRASLTGGGTTVLVVGLNDPHGPVFLDVAGNKMYWTDFGGGAIRRANLLGGGLTNLVTGLAGPDNLTLDIAGGKMYWTGRVSGDIRRANLDGTSQETLVQNLNAPSGIALDVASGHIYWTEYGGGTIQRSNLDGTGKTNLITGLSGPTVIALDLSDPSPPNITRATKTAGTFTLSWSALMGRGYQVQFKSDLAQTNWTDSGGPRTATNTTMTASSNVGSDPQRFHRVVRLP